MHLDTSISPAGLDVLIVEDIVDTGCCLGWLRQYLERRQPRSIRVCALLDKPSRRVEPVTIDYLGFSIPDHFVVGYGIDWNEDFRELPYVGFIPPEEGQHDR
jgi:hypoxanthine phosphoribosyltransferase